MSQLSSEHQIKKLNSERPKPTVELAPSPSGPVYTEVQSAEAKQKNREIDDRVSKMRERMSKDRGKARSAFERSR